MPLYNYIYIYITVCVCVFLYECVCVCRRSKVFIRMQLFASSFGSASSLLVQIRASLMSYCCSRCCCSCSSCSCCCCCCCCLQLDWPARLQLSRTLAHSSSTSSGATSRYSCPATPDYTSYTQVAALCFGQAPTPAMSPTDRASCCCCCCRGDA